jgi:hypothetical protein
MGSLSAERPKVARLQPVNTAAPRRWQHLTV